MDSKQIANDARNAARLALMAASSIEHGDMDSFGPIAAVLDILDKASAQIADVRYQTMRALWAANDSIG